MYLSVQEYVLRQKGIIFSCWGFFHNRSVFNMFYLSEVMEVFL